MSHFAAPPARRSGQGPPRDRDGRFRREPEASQVVSDTVYVGNIQPGTTSQMLHDLFSSAGHVIRANVITKAATGVFGRLFGFVQYASADEATRAIAQYDGKRMGDAALHVRFGNSNRVIKRRRLYMKNLPQGVDEERVAALCREYGEIEMIRFLTISHNVALVTYIKQPDADKALEALNGRVLPDSPYPLVVQYSENAQARLQRLSSVSEKCRLAEGTEL